nr:cold-responsive protein kinase 1-like [Ipomoea batatas]
MSHFFCCFGKKASPPRHQIDIEEEVSNWQDAKLYTYGELRVATGDFSPSNKIGKGGFGSVYKGRLKDGTLAAIKVLSAESTQGVKEFLNEIIAISGVEHENLVKLHGCCVEDDHRILVYGYVENNSLSQTLLGNLLSLSLFSIGSESAFFTRVSFVYRGYLAPEYAMRARLTRKADIYSFGVLLLEIVSGRCNTNKRLPVRDQFLLERAWRLYQSGELVELVDASIESTDIYEACRYVKIAFLCTQAMTKSRPSMSTVVKMLTGEEKVDDSMISEPGLLSELMGLRAQKKEKLFTTSSNSGNEGNSLSSGNTSTGMTQATMTFTSIRDRST